MDLKRPETVLGRAMGREGAEPHFSRQGRNGEFVQGHVSRTRTAFPSMKDASLTLRIIGRIAIVLGGEFPLEEDSHPDVD